MADFSRLPGPNADLWDWQLLAACRGVDSSLFFHPEGERGAARSAREASAKEVCMRCPVRAECAAHALQVREPYGVWGGLTEDEREELLGRARSRLVAAPHDRRAETTPGPGGAAPAPTPEPANPFGAPGRTGGSERRDEPDPAPDADERFDDAAAMDAAERFDNAEPLDGDEPFDELERFEQRERFDAADRYGRTEPVGER